MIRNFGKVICTFLVLMVIGTGLAGANSVPDHSSRLQVTGNAVVTAAPDLAIISLGVETNDESAEIAAQDNAERMEKILAALFSLGLSQKEITTSGYNIYSQKQVFNRGTEQEVSVTTYTVQNRLEITTAKLEQVGKIVDTAIQAGANQVQGIRFDISDKQELQLQALKNAVKQAHSKAEVMAEAAGVKIGGLVTMTEDYGTYAPMYDAPVMRASLANAETSINPGDIEISAKVTLNFWF